MAIGKSAKLYQERKCHRETSRTPGSRLHLEANLVHRIPMTPPLPHPNFVKGELGNPPPDRGLTKSWPHGELLIG